MEMDAEKKNTVGKSDARKRQGESTVPALPGSCARRESCYGSATGLPASSVAEPAIAEKPWHGITPKQKERSDSPQSQRYRGRGVEIHQKYGSSSDEEEEEEENEPIKRLRDPDSFEIELIDARLKYDKIIYKKDLASYTYMCVQQLTRFMSETDSAWANNEIDGVVYANLLYDLVQKKEEKLEETEEKLEETEEKLEILKKSYKNLKTSYANLKTSYANLKTSYAKLKAKQEKQKVSTLPTLIEEKETREIAVQTQVLTKEEGIQAQPQQVEEHIYGCLQFYGTRRKNRRNI